MQISPAARRYSVFGAAAVLLLAAAIAVASRASTEPSAAATPTPTPIPIRANPVIGPFQGLGVWVDLYDTSAWAHPASRFSATAAVRASSP